MLTKVDMEMSLTSFLWHKNVQNNLNTCQNIPSGRGTMFFTMLPLVNI